MSAFLNISYAQPSDVSTKFFSVTEYRVGSLQDFEIHGLSYRLTSQKDFGLIQELFLNPERTYQFWTLPYPQNFINDFIFCSELYFHNKNPNKIPYLLAWVVKNKQGKEIGIVGVDAFNQDYVDTIKGGIENAVVKKFIEKPYYEIFLILKQGAEGQGYGTLIMQDISDKILEGTNIQGLLSITHIAHSRSIQISRKAGFKDFAPVIFKLTSDSQEFERFIFLKLKKNVANLEM